jgi:hypothetical protein
MEAETPAPVIAHSNRGSRLRFHVRAVRVTSPRFSSVRRVVHHVRFCPTDEPVRPCAASHARFEFAANERPFQEGAKDGVLACGESGEASPSERVCAPPSHALGEPIGLFAALLLGVLRGFLRQFVAARDRLGVGNSLHERQRDDFPGRHAGIIS